MNMQAKPGKPQEGELYFTVVWWKFVFGSSLCCSDGSDYCKETLYSARKKQKKKNWDINKKNFD